MQNEMIIKKVDRLGNLYVDIDNWRSKKYVYKNITTYGSDQDIVSVPSDTRLHALTVVIYNKETTAITVTFKDGANQVYPEISVASKDYVYLDYSRVAGLVFTDTVKVLVSGTYSSGTQIFFGYLTEYTEPNVS